MPGRDPTGPRSKMYSAALLCSLQVYRSVSEVMERRARTGQRSHNKKKDTHETREITWDRVEKASTSTVSVYLYL